MARQNLSKDESVDDYIYEMARQRRYNPSMDDSVDDYFYDKVNPVSAAEAGISPRKSVERFFQFCGAGLLLVDI